MKRNSHPLWTRLANALTAVALLSVALSACSPATATTNPASNPTTAATVPAAEKTTLRIAVLPIIDALPFYVAQKEGYFTRNQLEVTFIPAASAAERDQLIASGQADGMINDLVSVALYNKQQVQIQTVDFARVADAKNAMYRVLAAKESGIQSAANLAGVPIGVSQGTVIEYVTSRMLEREGVTADQIQTVAVPKLPDRLALLGKGELKAATLPEPYGAIAQQSGSVILVDDTKYPEYGYSVISFRKTVIDEHPEAIRGFLNAIHQAAQDINNTPETWRTVLAENKMVPEAVQASYPIPPFQKAAVPTEAQWKDVIDWMKAHTLIDVDMPYADSITGQYLP